MFSSDIRCFLRGWEQRQLRFPVGGVSILAPRCADAPRSPADPNVQHGSDPFEIGSPTDNPPGRGKATETPTAHYLLRTLQAR